jgi:hypothetical protein
MPNMELRNCCHFSLRELFIFKTSSIRDKKTEAITDPAMLLSVEPSAFQNHIAKRISATKSITARSEYGPDTLAGLMLVLLNMVLAKPFSP